eukprot:TRINITY_DN22154_c0_g1_i1.p2 TRINITY_DN22154_c0_g1~~TRINITY_DN22154_c0_g1_i1.p2  ORF type:complete len:213 (+),score=35.20 TRINITY_DN22154_c0_g1_i1:92-730(+)
MGCGASSEKEVSGPERETSSQRDSACSRGPSSEEQQPDAAQSPLEDAAPPPADPRRSLSWPAAGRQESWGSADHTQEREWAPRPKATRRLPSEEFEAFTTTSTLPDDDTTLVGVEECPLCLETYEADDKMRTLGCSHFFHRSCIDEWLRRAGTCPVCCQTVKCCHVLRKRDSVIDLQRLGKGGRDNTEDAPPISTDSRSEAGPGGDGELLHA